MIITNSNDPGSIYDKHFQITCPHCGVLSNITAISIPRYEFLARYKPPQIGIVYRCDSCNLPIFIKFSNIDYQTGSNRVVIDPSSFTEIEKHQETFDFQYLPDEIEKDFKEALVCYSHDAYNGFAAMCRRTIQSTFTHLGAEGKTKVKDQYLEVNKTLALDDDTSKILEQIIIAGHDGAHPHLPELSESRAVILLELMKDVLYQLFVRKAKIQESIDLRKEEITKAKEDEAPEPEEKQ